MKASIHYLIVGLLKFKATAMFYHYFKVTNINIVIIYYISTIAIERIRYEITVIP